MANLQAYENAESFSVDITKIKRGDIIGVKGYPTRTKTGELSVVPRKMELLSPCLHAMPHYYGLKDKVKRSCLFSMQIRRWTLVCLICLSFLGNAFPAALLGPYYQC